MEIIVSDVAIGPLFFLALWTAIVCVFTANRLKDKRLKIMFALLCCSVFLYSGYGIAFPEVDDRYLLYYFIFIACFSIPVLLLRDKGLVLETQMSSRLDLFFETHMGFLKKCSYAYLLCLFIPLVYPEFKLLDFIHNGFNGLIGFYDLRVQYQSNTLINVIDTLKVFLCPFFYIYLTEVKEVKPFSRQPVCLFLLSILFEYMRYSYMGRYQMVINALLLFFILSCAKGYSFNINFKQLAYIVGGVVLAIPFLYAFTFIRQGNAVENAGGFVETVKMLINSEAYYPIYYDHILTSPNLKSQTPMTFILWLLFLPIPSVIWPGKPTLQSDAFTYSLSGLHYGEYGYSSYLPSVMGESFIYFGIDFFWVQAIIMATIMIMLFHYLLKHRSTNLLLLYLIVYVLSIGRGGAASYMSTLIFGVLPIYIIDHFYLKHR